MDTIVQYSHPNYQVLTLRVRVARVFFSLLFYEKQMFISEHNNKSNTLEGKAKVNQGQRK
jgi:hypothetical protein